MGMTAMSDGRQVMSGRSKAVVVIRRRRKNSQNLEIAAAVHTSSMYIMYIGTSYLHVEARKAPQRPTTAQHAQQVQSLPNNSNSSAAEAKVALKVEPPTAATGRQHLPLLPECGQAARLRGWRLN